MRLFLCQPCPVRVGLPVKMFGREETPIVAIDDSPGMNSPYPACRLGYRSGNICPDGGPQPR